MSYKEIVFEENGIKQTWKGELTTVVFLFPKARILNVQVLKEETEQQEQQQHQNQDLKEMTFSLIS